MSDFEPTGEFPVIRPGENEPDPQPEVHWYRGPGGIGAIAAVVVALVILVIVLATSGGDGDDEVLTAEGTPTPEESVEPTVEPTPSPEPDASPSAEPTAGETPAGSPTPIATPTVEATPTPEATAEPTATEVPTATPEATSGECSADGLDALDDQLDLPEEVATLRAAIGDAAIGCDLDGLVSMTDTDFTASFGGGDARDVWESDEVAGGEPLRWLVEILRLPYGVIEPIGEEPIYVWPSAHAYESWDAVPRTDRQALLEVYTGDNLADFEAFGAYTGYRVGITQTGRWIYFVIGD